MPLERHTRSSGVELLWGMTASRPNLGRKIEIALVPKPDIHEAFDLVGYAPQSTT